MLRLVVPGILWAMAVQAAPVAASLYVFESEGIGPDDLAETSFTGDVAGLRTAPGIGARQSASRSWPCHCMV
jgi:hypothetical protein